MAALAPILILELPGSKAINVAPLLALNTEPIVHPEIVEALFPFRVT